MKINGVSKIQPATTSQQASQTPKPTSVVDKLQVEKYLKTAQPPVLGDTEPATLEQLVFRTKI